MDKASLRRMLEEFERDNAKLKQARVLIWGGQGQVSVPSAGLC